LSVRHVAEFEHASKRYSLDVWGKRSVLALDGVSFRIETGQVFGLLGPNRAGKTTLVKLLLSLCKPTGGRIERLGKPVSDRSTLGSVGYMHENQAFPRYLTAPALLEYYAALAHVPAVEVRRRVQELLERVGLADRSEEPISGFSKGMVQRLALAQALVNDPELLVFDEPAEGLDLSGRRLLQEVIQGQRRRGRSVLLVSHVISEVERLCDRVGVVVNGKLAHVGPVSALTMNGSRPLEQALQTIYEKAAS
jgi:ABC-2 type transport system ATP-binding protein